MIAQLFAVANTTYKRPNFHDISRHGENAPFFVIALSWERLVASRLSLDESCNLNAVVRAKYGQRFRRDCS